MRSRALLSALVLCLCSNFAAAQDVPKEHPRLFGSRARLQALKASRPVAYKEVIANAHNAQLGDLMRMLPMSLVCAIDGDQALGKEAVKMALKLARGPIRVGHETFGHDLAYAAIVYDLCYECWTDAERKEYIDYYNKTVEANVKSEVHVFANGYYGYKNWGIGLGGYATYYENPKAPDIIRALQVEVKTRAAPAMDVAGDGGGWAEGYYEHYFLYEWLVFCEVARTCEGVDYYAMSPKFFRNAGVASMFLMFPGTLPHEMNRAVPMGDGGYGVYGGVSERLLAARRILTTYYKNDPQDAFVHAYNQRVPECCIPEAYSSMNFLWHEKDLPTGDLHNFKLSHCSLGPGWVAARSSWDPDATYFFFHSSKRYGAHQHLDAGHFLIYKEAQLAGDGGVYDDFGGQHAGNYYIRSIAHNTLLVFDPSEKTPDGMRACGPIVNDGGQAFPWVNTSMGHNGGLLDLDDLNKNRQLMDIADILAYDDQKSFLYTATDITRAYAAQKMACCTRQIVYLRPNTFVIFDRVVSKNPSFKKTWLLQAMQIPTKDGDRLVVTNGKGRLHVQTVLPTDVETKLNSGAELYSYGGHSFPPKSEGEECPKCRVEISPKTPAAADYFLHVLTTSDVKDAVPPLAEGKLEGDTVTVKVNGAVVRFKTGSVGGSVEIGGQRVDLTNRVAIEPLPPVKSSDPVASGSPSSGGTPAPMPVAHKAEPSAEDKALAEKRFAELKALVIKSVAAGKKELAPLPLYGQDTPARITAADDKELTAEVEGMGGVKVAWAKLSPRHVYNLAKKYSEDHRALYEYCSGMGLEHEAQAEAFAR